MKRTRAEIQAYVAGFLGDVAMGHVPTERELGYATALAELLGDRRIIAEVKRLKPGGAGAQLTLENLPPAVRAR